MTAADLDQLRDKAVRLLQDALQKPPTELKSEVDDAERAVAALRDAIIERFRAAPAATLRADLDAVNVALSLVIGLEYPMGGIQRPMLEQARRALERGRTEAPRAS